MQPATPWCTPGTNQAALLRFDSTGAEALSQTIPGGYANYFPGFAVDAAGNAYISGFSSKIRGLPFARKTEDREKGATESSH